MKPLPQPPLIAVVESPARKKAAFFCLCGVGLATTWPTKNKPRELKILMLLVRYPASELKLLKFLSTRLLGESNYIRNTLVLTFGTFKILGRSG